MLKNKDSVLYWAPGKNKGTSIIQWSARVIDIGVHYCKEKSRRTGKLESFWYAYDLTSYHVASGTKPTEAIENLLHVIWGGEVLAKEFRAKGERIIRNRLHQEHPDAIRDFKAAIKKWNGYVIKGVDWRKWHTVA